MALVLNLLRAEINLVNLRTLILFSMSLLAIETFAASSQADLCVSAAGKGLFSGEEAVAVFDEVTDTEVIPLLREKAKSVKEGFVEAQRRSSEKRKQLSKVRLSLNRWLQKLNEHIHPTAMINNGSAINARLLTVIDPKRKPRHKHLIEDVKGELEAVLEDYENFPESIFSTSLVVGVNRQNVKFMGKLLRDKSFVNQVKNLKKGEFVEIVLLKTDGPKKRVLKRRKRIFSISDVDAEIGRIKAMNPLVFKLFAKRDRLIRWELGKGRVFVLPPIFLRDTFFRQAERHQILKTYIREMTEDAGGFAHRLYGKKILPRIKEAVENPLLGPDYLSLLREASSSFGHELYYYFHHKYNFEFLGQLRRKVLADESREDLDAIMPPYTGRRPWLFPVRYAKVIALGTIPVWLFYGTVAESFESWVTIPVRTTIESVRGEESSIGNIAREENRHEEFSKYLDRHVLFRNRDGILKVAPIIQKRNEKKIERSRRIFQAALKKVYEEKKEQLTDRFRNAVGKLIADRVVAEYGNYLALVREGGESFGIKAFRLAQAQTGNSMEISTREEEAKLFEWLKNGDGINPPLELPRSAKKVLQKIKTLKLEYDEMLELGVNQAQAEFELIFKHLFSKAL